MKDLRVIIALPLIIPMFIGVMIIYLFGFPFLAIGGKKSHSIFDAITSLIAD